MSTKEVFRVIRKVLISFVVIVACLGCLWLYWSEYVERRRMAVWRDFVSEISSKVDVDELQRNSKRLFERREAGGLVTDSLPDSLLKVDVNIPNWSIAVPDDLQNDKAIDIWWRMLGGYKGILVGSTALDPKRFSQLVHGPYTLNIRSNVVLYCQFGGSP